MIIWADIESSGLDERTGHLLEVAVVVTDDNLVERAHASVVTLPIGVTVDEMVEKLDPYVRNMHTKNGLIDDLKTKGVRRFEAEALLVDVCQSAMANEPMVGSHRCVHCKLNEKDHIANRSINDEGLCADGKLYEEKMDPAIKHTPLAGSTIPFDRRWLREHMPKLEGLFSHRHVDVSTITELAKRWQPEIYELRPRSTDEHRALADVRGSIELLRFYRDTGIFDSYAANAIKSLEARGLKVTR